jgi:hypothetical protein
MTTLQKTIVAAALALAAGTGLYAVHQSSQLRAQLQTLQQEQAPLTAQLRLLEQEHTQAAQQLAALKEENARLKSGPSATELLKLRGQVGVLRQRAATNDAKAAPASGLAKMMSDPAMKEYVRQAQLQRLRSLYADLFKELQLTPEQTDQFLQLSVGKASTFLAKFTAPAQGAPDPAPAEAANDRESQMRALLGDAGYARYNEFSDELPARSTVSLLNSQLGASPLNNEQSASLIQVVKAEPSDLTAGIMGAPDKAFLGSQADIDSFLDQVAASNQRIEQQAANFLSADQLAALNNVLTNSINTRKLTAAAFIQKH